MYNFFVNNNQVENETVQIIGQDAKHISNVLRMKNGDEIYICNIDNKERYLAEIEKINKDEVIVKLIQKLESIEPHIKITLFQGIPKADKMEYIIQKAVELGAYNIIPVDMKFCISKIKDENKKIARWQAISEAAAKQSKRSIIPKIEMPKKLSEVCNILSQYDLVIVAYEDEDKTTIKQVLNTNNDKNNIAIIIGPEGGISPDEIKVLSESGAKLASLGRQILRTETASIAMISMIMYEYEMR